MGHSFPTNTDQFAATIRDVSEMEATAEDEGFSEPENAENSSPHLRKRHRPNKDRRIPHAPSNDSRHKARIPLERKKATRRYQQNGLMKRWQQTFGRLSPSFSMVEVSLLRYLVLHVKIGCDSVERLEDIDIENYPFDVLQKIWNIISATLLRKGSDFAEWVRPKSVKFLRDKLQSLIAIQSYEFTVPAKGGRSGQSGLLKSILADGNRLAELAGVEGPCDPISSDLHAEPDLHSRDADVVSTRENRGIAEDRTEETAKPLLIDNEKRLTPQVIDLIEKGRGRQNINWKDYVMPRLRAYRCSDDVCAFIYKKYRNDRFRGGKRVIASQTKDASENPAVTEVPLDSPHDCVTEMAAAAHARAGASIYRRTEEPVPCSNDDSVRETHEKGPDDGKCVQYALLRRLLTSEMPTIEQMEAETLPEPTKRRFSPAENFVFDYMLDTFTERQRFCMGLSTKNKIDWNRFHHRWIFICKVLVIRSRNGERMPFDGAELFSRAAETFKQKNKDKNRNNNV